jgi:hypothetical protein
MERENSLNPPTPKELEKTKKANEGKIVNE